MQNFSSILFIQIIDKQKLKKKMITNKMFIRFHIGSVNKTRKFPINNFTNEKKTRQVGRMMGVDRIKILTLENKN